MDSNRFQGDSHFRHFLPGTNLSPWKSVLTHLSRMDFPTLISRRSLFPIYGCWVVEKYVFAYLSGGTNGLNVDLRLYFTLILSVCQQRVKGAGENAQKRKLVLYTCMR